MEMHGAPCLAGKHRIQNRKLKAAVSYAHMKKKKLTYDCVQTVLNCDDTLREILLRVPPESLSKLVIVSKRLLHFVCSSSFRNSYLGRWKPSFRLLGFFVCNYLYIGRPRDGLRRPSWEPAIPFFSTCKEGDDLRFSGTLKQLGYFIGSSNGMIFCGRHPKTYHVWNPLTRQKSELPEPLQFYQMLCMAFLVEDYFDDVISYKVIRAKCECKPKERDRVSIETFSSKTGRWKQSTLTCSKPFALCPWTVGDVIRGVVYWFAKWRNLAVYDRRLGERRIALIKLPAGRMSNEYEVFVLGESADGLVQFGQSNNFGLEIWILEKELDGFSTTYASDKYLARKWVLRWKLNFKVMWKQNPYISVQSKESEILGFLPQNSQSVFIRCGCNIYLCHLETRTVEVVCYQGRATTISWESSRAFPFFVPCWPESSMCHDLKLEA